ncbi:MAG: hypothetical protein RLZZ399_394 [Verrucomicrobiota bacterium]|jgi:hypothetical protein
MNLPNSLLNASLSRRALLSRFGAGTGLLGLGALLGEQAVAAPASPLAPKAAHFRPRAKRVIHLFMNGGPSQVDTFDPKPELTKHHGTKPPRGPVRNSVKTGNLLGSPFAFRPMGQSGIPVSEIFPQVGSCIDDICVIRSMHTNIPNHEPALLLMTSGEAQPTRPSFGSWLTYGLGTENANLPGFVVLCPGSPVVGPQLWSSSFLPGSFQGVQVNNSSLEPKRIIENISNQRLGPRAQREMVDLLGALNRRHADAHRGDDPFETRIQSLEMAFRMQFEAQDAFDLSSEPEPLRAAYGKSPFAQACLTARRLVERGVRVVQVFSGAGQPWDNHNDILIHRRLAQDSDQPIAMLLRDLRQRGLLEDTLVLWGGEFGRTPASEGSVGRDHNHLGFTVWMAGGGVKGGFVYGATDELGFAAVDKRMHVHDLHATILHLMGINHEQLTYRYSGRDFRLTDVHGEVAHEIIA